MKWKSLKRGLAIVLSVLMITSSASVYAEKPQSPQTQTETDRSVESPQDSEFEADGESNPEGSESGEGSEILAESKPEEDSETPTESRLTTETEPTETTGTEPAETGTPDTTETGTTGETETPDTTETEMTRETETPSTTETEMTRETETPDTTETGTIGETETPDTTETEMTKETETIVEEETELETETQTETETETETEEIVAFADIQNVVTFNTGNLEISVIPCDDYSDELFEACLDDNIYVVPFDEDGNFTIEVEADAFFPYEVQFQYDGKIENRWFLSPYDRNTVGGHTFCIHSEFSGDVITQMSLKVAGKTVVVYPQKKEFTNDGGISAYSLMPLEEKYLTVDLTGLNPLQLTRVAVSSVFAGEKSINAEKIAWNSHSGDDYKIISTGDIIDLSYGTSDGGTTWEMIVGDGDQLNLSNVRYQVNVRTDQSGSWFVPAVYERNSDESLTDNLVKSAEYRDSGAYYSRSDWDWLRYEEIYLYDSGITGSDAFYLKLNKESFGSDNVRVYKGRFDSPDEAGQAEEITSEIFDSQGYKIGYNPYDSNVYANITLISSDSNENITGFLPLRFEVHVERERFDFSVWNEKDEKCYYAYSSRIKNDCRFFTYELYKGNLADQQYYLKAYHFVNDSSNSSAGSVIVYKGLYNTIEEAQNNGAEDITSTIFGKGCFDNYSQGVDFTFFSNDKVFYYNVKVIEGEHEKKQSQSMNSNANLYIYGLVDANGSSVKAYVVDANEDSYAERNYLTVLVDQDVDWTNLALYFSVSDNAKLYCEGSSTPEESRKTLHDFSKGEMRYTVSAEDGEHATNYVVQFIKVDTSNARLYINSLADTDARTEVRDGVTYTTREVMIDGLHNYIHDILIANMGSTNISKISVELDSNVVALDSYWTLSGNQNLGTFNSSELDNETSHDKLSNLAKIRLKQKDDVADGTDVSGTLKIKEDGKDLIVMTLTGTVGDPSIITTEIPNAVKYVPYGTMIQNSNKYSQNKVSYLLYSGKFPEGMELKPNGEIYGVPKETGTFHINVRMTNSISNFSSCYREFDLVVLDNTDENVNNATDEGYTLSTRLSQADAEYVVVSEGVFPNFKNIYIDGDQLVKDVDYDAESGSTRITIRSETLSKKGSGVHTLGIEFREGGEDTGELKRAAQNYDAANIGVVKKPSGNNNSNNNNSGSGSSGNSDSNSSSSSSSQAVSDNKDVSVEVVPVEDFAYKEGYAMMQANLSRDKVLRAELLNKYYGQPKYMNIVFSADFGLTIDMANVPMMVNDVEIAYSIVSAPMIASEFDVIHAIPKAIKPLGFEAIFNFHIGDAYVGKKTYIYVLNEQGIGYELIGTYDLIGTTIVNEIGNIAFALTSMTDVIIFVER